ncbi:MAG: alkaline phosphatase family protein [Rhodomicrobium sp.]
MRAAAAFIAPVLASTMRCGYRKLAAICLGLLVVASQPAHAQEICDPDVNPCCKYKEFRTSFREDHFLPSYLPADSVDLAKIPAVPPEPVTGVEVEELRRLQKQAGPDLEIRACLDHARTVAQFLALPGFEATVERLKPCEDFFRHIDGTVEEVIGAAKDKFNRERPYKLAPTLTPLKKIKKKDEASFPSGHATYGTLIGLILADLLPDRREDIYRRMESYGYSRLLARVHYRSDVYAGHIAGELIYSQLQKDKGYIDAFQEAKRTCGTPDISVDRYEHIFIIIAENRSFKQIIGNPDAPRLNKLASEYGLATQYYGVVHPSEANYIAMLGGSTFGIHDDDAWYCRRGVPGRDCSKAETLEPYVDHTITARNFLDQLAEHGLSWKGYFEGIPSPGSMTAYYPDQESPVAGRPMQLYASKHNGFINFKTAQDDPHLGAKLVGFDQLDADLKGDMPNYAHIVPDQCDDMHGLDGSNVREECKFKNSGNLIAHGDKVIGELVDRIMNAPVWRIKGNTAIVVTWDEDNSPEKKEDIQGCCGYEPKSAANFGGGHIPTIVITNHGPGHILDGTPYNHYSLLRTCEDAFGIAEHLGLAGASEKGVKPMSALFATSPRP